MGDPLTGVVRTLDRACMDGVRLIEARSSPWASATFVGGRHSLLIALHEAEALRLSSLIEEMEFAISGHLVADMKLVTVTRGAEETMMLEFLTVEAG